ncbi:chromatin assembly factor 1 subunit B-like [Liolophura sinensis]|uniref:chromatin assembly factor 1 subunit B-like n=1 Tax=Liolophura sinensis TaxID=3198878 RepID=UPI003159682A
MKVNTPEIFWHGREPVYSLDFQPGKRSIQRLASAGVDKTVRMWSLVTDKDGKGNVEFLSSLTRHSRSVNVVRFSPSGDILASAGDDSVIILWKLNDSTPPAGNIFQEDEEDNKETWSTVKILRGHPEEVYDLCWSADGKSLISGSVDNSAILWDTIKDTKLAKFHDHKSFVQGVTIDPLGEFAASLSSDRSCRVFSIASKNCVNNISKMTLPAHLAPASDTNTDSKPKSFRIYHDDTMRSFFRRLNFSPDGELLVTPAGCFEQGEKLLNCTYVFTRQGFSKPVLHLPSQQKVTIVVKFSPVLYELRKVPKVNSQDKENNNLKEWEKYETLFSFPYRMVFAVGTEDSVLLYDTQQSYPFAFVGNIHYHQLSDLSWTSDGNCLIVSSTDGYCTIVRFEEGEIGVPYSRQVVPTTKLFYPSTDQPNESSISPEQMTVSETTPQPTASPGTSQPIKTEKLLRTPERSPSVSEGDKAEEKMEVDPSCSDLHLVLEMSCDSAPTKTPTDERVQSCLGDTEADNKDSEKFPAKPVFDLSAAQHNADAKAMAPPPPVKPMMTVRSTDNSGGARRVQLTTLSLLKPK